MVSNELKAIVERLRQRGEMSFCEGATEGQIIDFELKNRIKLPKKYKEWLRFSDGGECFLPAGIQLYGVAHDPCIDVNENDRPSSDYVVIGALATGDPIVFLNAEEKVSIYNHESGEIEDDESYTDFFAFLNDLDSLLGIGE